MKPAAAQAGASITMTGADKTVLAYGGSWGKDGRSAYPRGNIQKAYGVSVAVNGNPDQAKTLLAGLNGTALAGLLK